MTGRHGRRLLEQMDAHDKVVDAVRFEVRGASVCAGATRRPQ
ncbi:MULTISPECIES: hypothetical protein [Mycetohabitans]|nr:MULTISPECIES: hypothetical protein [Mycetohabitans]